MHHQSRAVSFRKVQFRSGFTENNPRFDWHSRLFETFDNWMPIADKRQQQ